MWIKTVPIRFTSCAKLRIVYRSNYVGPTPTCVLFIVPEEDSTSGDDYDFY